ncbi:unnamed protein product [Tilletia caries]|uniref:Integrase catalytic domain-containing protein n=1 Tax=Tilletia caries TaxID=13290 RepID=A0ABN7IWA5_9BASI|nr:unnamed protein product [Tilletia caries]
MTPNASCFAAIEPSTTAVVLADGKRILARGRGTVVLHTVGQDGNVPGELVLFDVLLIPELRYNLISVFKLNQDHLRVHFDEHFEATITDPFQRSFKVCAIWSWQSQAYVITVMTGTDVSAFFVLDDDEERSGAPDNEELAPPLAGDRLDRFVTMWRLWHERLGHAGSSTLPVLAQNSVGLPEPLWLRRADQSTICRCETCSLTNIKRTPFPTSTTKTTRALELVHGDLTGRVIVKSLGGAEYLAVLVDDYTRMVWVIPLARKSDFVAKFIAWRDEVVPFKGPIGCLRTDGGGEFNNAAIKAALLGARHEKSCAYTSQQNGVAERYVGLIKNVMRPLLHGRNIPLEYWAEAASTAAYIRNRCPSSALDGKTPYELWHGTQPQLGNLRVFGCLAFAMLSDRERAHSLAARGRVGVFIGYDNYHKGYRIHFPDTGEVKVTKFVDFHEHKGYDFSTLDSPSSHADQPPAPHSAARRPRIVVIGPRPPAPSPHPPATVELLDDGDEPIPAPPPPPAAPVGVAPEPAASEAPLPAPVAPARAEIPPPAAPQQQQPQPPARSNARARPQPTISYQTRLHVRRLQDGREQRQANMAQRLVPYDGQSTEAQQKLFQAELGYLNWLAQASRPDLMHFVAYLSRHAKNPGPIHIACMKRAFRYLAGTIDMKLRIAAHSQDDVVAYSDSDFGGDHSAKSTSGWCVSVYGATVAWGSKLQTLVADSTAQAELIAVWQTSREVMAIRRFFEDLGFRVDGEGQPSVIYCDNQPAIHIISNPVSNGLTRHMERKYLSTREQQERGFINIKYINTRDNPSDMFTKSLPPITFHQHRNTIGIIHHPSTST